MDTAAISIRFMLQARGKGCTVDNNDDIDVTVDNNDDYNDDGDNDDFVFILN